MSFQIRRGRKSDLPRVLELVKELAVFENALKEVTLTVEMMEKDGFSDPPVFHFIVADNTDNYIAGMALWFFRYSTWKGRTLFLEDLIVSETHRGNGIGKALFEKVLQIARNEDCQRVSWQVLDWNKVAIDFYKSYGAKVDGTWLNCDLYKDQLGKI